MEAVKSFNEELSGIYETKPPISRAKMTTLTKKAIKGIKFYKHIVQSVEKFIQKCRPEYKVPGLYVVDSVVRQSRHQFGPEKDVFMPRLCKNILTTFQHIYKCPPEDKPRVLRVLNLWQKNNVFPPEIVQQLMVMGGAPTPAGSAGASGVTNVKVEKPGGADATNLTNILANLIANPDATKVQSLAGLLSSSQQNQLQDLLHQVKGTDQLEIKEEIVEEYVDEVEIKEEIIEEYMEPETNNIPSAPDKIKQEATFHPHNQATSRNLPFLQSQSIGMHDQKPAFNRAVLDFDYSDDEQTPPNNNAQKQHKPGIDPALLAKLPTPDQIQQLTIGNGVMQQRMDPELERRRRLEEEQENFNKQIQEMSTTMRDQSEGSQRSAHKRRRSRSRSKERRHRHRRSHSRERGHRSRRSRSRSRDRSRKSQRSRSQSRERRRENDKGFPPQKFGCISVCTTTLWIGNISSKVMQHELQALVEEHGKVESINMIPPRGCAYICMKERAEASKALYKIRHVRLAGKSLKCDWAPSKEMPEEQKVTWVKEHGVNYVPVSPDPNQLRQLTTWGFVDPDSVPLNKKDELARLMNTNEVVPVAEPQAMHPLAQMMQGQPTQLGFGVMPGMQMAPRPQMPMIVRPGFQMAGMAPFGVPRSMTLSQPTNIPQARPEIKESGETTPTRDEQMEDRPPQTVQPQFPSPFGGVSVAQRFPGQMPVHIRMMPGMMQPRMGVMPIRMGVPMQLRPGFHPAMGARMPIAGGPGMVPNAMHPQLRQVTQLPQQTPVSGMPGAMHLRMAPPPAEMTQQQPITIPPPVIPNQANVERDIAPERPIDMPNPRDRSRSREREERNPRRPDDFPHPRDVPPKDFDRAPPNFDRQRSFESDGGNYDRGRPPMNRDRGYDRDRDRDRNQDRERNMGRDRGRERSDERPRGFGRFPRDREMGRGPPRDFDRGPRDRGRDFDRDRRMPPRDFERRDRGDRGPPSWGFRGRDDRGRRGGFDRGFSGRGGPRGQWGREERRRSPSLDPEEEEYKRKRQETLRKRRDDEEVDYVAEEVDLSSFGLPSGFGGPMSSEDAPPSSPRARNRNRDSPDEKAEPPSPPPPQRESFSPTREIKREIKEEYTPEIKQEPESCNEEPSSQQSDNDQYVPEVKEEYEEPASHLQDDEEVKHEIALSPKREYVAIKNSPGTPTVDEHAKSEAPIEDSFNAAPTNIKSELSESVSDLQDDSPQENR